MAAAVSTASTLRSELGWGVGFAAFDLGGADGDGATEVEDAGAGLGGAGVAVGLATNGQGFDATGATVAAGACTVTLDGRPGPVSCRPSA